MLELLKIILAFAPKSEGFAIARSKNWSKLSKQWIKINPCCAVCGSKEKCVPHHKKPVHLFPEFELDENNLVTLCPDHHLLFGHLMQWRSFNSSIEEDILTWNNKIKNRP